MHNNGGRLAARLLQALGDTVSEAKEEGLVRLANGLKATYSTVTVTYDDTHSTYFCALIDAADATVHHVIHVLVKYVSLLSTVC